MTADRDAELREALRTHKPAAFTGVEIACACDRKWRLASAYREHVADALLPVVQAYARRVAAEELNAQQDYADSYEGDGLIRPADIRARAAALAADDDSAGGARG